jgi:membrane-associated phospholipid phosphatase
LHAQTGSCTTPFSEALLQFGKRERDRIFTDYGNLYNQNNVKNYGLALLGAGVMANTKIDGEFQNWYGRHVRSNFTNEFSKVSKTFGEGQFFIPIIATSAVTYRLLQEKHGWSECKVGEFADRTMRGYLVGFPTLLVAQSVLGADRPRDDGGSYWRPFRQDHGVSGHAFMGAIPFMTAAQMAEKPCVKGVFYVLSTFTAWSRVNDDAHYLSQALLGWYLAYLSVRAVSETESRYPLPRGLTIFPVCGDSSVGIGLHYQY